MPDLMPLQRYLTEHRQQFEDDLCELLRIPSVSADRNYAGDVRRAADWVAGRLRRLGLASEVIETDGNPLVYAESPPVPGAPTVLVYGHYDVQPADPLDQWTSPPFEPTVRDGNLYARGATDDKGQMLTHVNSVQAWIETAGQLPLQVKFLIEGEEEVGSESLNKFLERSADKLACNVVVVSDTAQFAPGQPAITYGLRGIAYFELRLTGPKHDLHSGTFGGGVTNPANALARMLAALVDNDGRVQVPGFYDDVIPLTDRERAQFAALAFDEQAFMERIGVDGLTGEVGYTNLERRWARPTCDINGIWGGYQGEGGKTVLPSKAGAKFSFRLVPRQDPHRVAAGLRELLSPICPPGIKLELIEMHGAPGALVSLDSPYMQAAARAIELGFERPPVFIREGGSIPIVTAFYERLGVDTLLLGWGLDDDNAHGPNEKFSLADFHRGIRASAYLWQELAGQGI
ncbi:MAG TPA: dipeptidase [Candidatus Anammoximicrobium sp.]|nr:dipeptidase [Candidatus Anammoximicrobium sp.]